MHGDRKGRLKNVVVWWEKKKGDASEIFVGISGVCVCMVLLAHINWVLYFAQNELFCANFCVNTDIDFY